MNNCRVLIIILLMICQQNQSFGQLNYDSALLLSYNNLGSCNDTIIDSLTINTKEYIALKDTLEKLEKIINDSAKVKRAALGRAIESIRYISCISAKNDYTIVVNIPSATALLYQQDKILLESKVIVGRTYNRTPVIGSKISEIILYPYWFVPKSIATNELLPMIKKNTGFLEVNGFQVLNSSGKVIDSYSVNWKDLSRSNFPYTLRQSTGCDNSLGIIKLNFYNPFNVYLHDTPWKNLFTRTKRFYSHGCVRVEKAIEIAHYLLQNNSVAVDTLKIGENIPHKNPVPIPLKISVPILILYNTAWMDSGYNVSFYPDIYQKLKIK